MIYLYTQSPFPDFKARVYIGIYPTYDSWPRMSIVTGPHCKHIGREEGSFNNYILLTQSSFQNWLIGPDFCATRNCNLSYLFCPGSDIIFSINSPKYESVHLYQKIIKWCKLF